MVKLIAKYEAYDSKQPEPDEEPVTKRKTIHTGEFWYNGSILEWYDDDGRRHSMRAKSVRGFTDL